MGASVEKGVEKNDEFELRGVNHIAMVASDMHATIEFYNGVLGMPLIKTLNIPGGGQHFFFDIGNGDSLAFFWFPGAPASVPGVSSPEFLPGKGSIVTAHGSMNHLAFDVPLERFEGYRERLVAKGVDVSPIVDHDDSESTIAKVFHPGVFVRSFYFQGPDNVMLEFASWTRTMGGPDDVKHAPLNADGVEVEVVYG
jgi:catechol 2,3-dioxygenase-like lactoylglutathione lyase family enzyme